MRRLAAVLLSAAALSWTGAAPSHAAERLPLSLALRIRFEGGSPSARLADDVAATVLAEFRAKGCFRDASVAPAEGIPGGDALLEVTLSQVHEETRYEQSLAERAQPQDVSATALGYAALLALRADLKLAALPSGEVVRTGGFHVAVERRPRMAGDDARAGARIDAMRDLARKTRSTICRGSVAKLEREIEAARGAP